MGILGKENRYNITESMILEGATWAEGGKFQASYPLCETCTMSCMLLYKRQMPHNKFDVITGVLSLPPSLPSLIPRPSLSFSQACTCRKDVCGRLKREGEREPGQARSHAWPFQPWFTMNIIMSPQTQLAQTTAECVGS